MALTMQQRLDHPDVVKFYQRVDELRQKYDITRQQAIERIAKSEGALHRRFLAAVNRDRPSAIAHLVD